MKSAVRPAAVTAPRVAAPAQPPIDAADKAFLASAYAAAERLYSSVLADPAHGDRARLGLARIFLVTGRYEQAAEPHPNLAPEAASDLRQVRARALAALGDLSAATALLQPPQSPSPTPTERLLLGELLLELGQTEPARAALMSLIEEYNEGVIPEGDAAALSRVGRAAYLLRSPEDANDAFNEAELAGAQDERTLLWRGELFLDKYDVGHAEEVLKDLLGRAPHHPDALVMLAETQLEVALDFDRARTLAERALETNPRHAGAYGVLAGLAIRDLELERAERHLTQGLRAQPKDLTLLSLLGAVRFLADDSAGFAEVKGRVLAQNPTYTRFYQIVSKYADWEHRYEEIVPLMREAIALDPDDAKAYADLGVNLIRNGDDPNGVAALQQAFARDPYNVRVFNTLNLYEKTIPSSYQDVSGSPFRLRYPSAERAVLERYVPTLLSEAWGKMRDYYQFTPTVPVGVELYSERQNFAIRTSGLPHTAIQGVCFGKTLAAMSPRHEAFNLGMTLWHELAHVFHIQLSKAHVPRWFTEGLAEYETLVERTEWKREHDAELFVALRENRLPRLAAMNKAFTHAEDLADVSVAYYASSQIVTMLAERYGRAKLRQMLILWGQGATTERVLFETTGKSTEALDAEFTAYLRQRLARFDGQFVPPERVGDPEAVVREAERRPEDPDLQVRLALFMLRQDQLDLAEQAVEAALDRAPKHHDAQWVKARVVMAQGNAKLARTLLTKLVEAGHDGYELRMLEALALRELGDKAAEIDALRRAHEFDPAAAAPIQGLIVNHPDQPTARLGWFRQLGALEEHDGSVFRELVHRELAAGNVAAALTWGQSAVYAAMEDPSAHVAYAKALAAAGRSERAGFEFESALLCPAEPDALALAHLEYAQHLEKSGKRSAAEAQRAQAHKLDPKAALGSEAPSR